MAEGSEKKYVRICVDCGKVMRTAGRCTMRCPECNETHRKIENRTRKSREKAKKLQAHKENEALRKVVRQADAAGKSYGKFVSDQMLQAQKGAS